MSTPNTCLNIIIYKKIGFCQQSQNRRGHEPEPSSQNPNKDTPPKCFTTTDTLLDTLTPAKTHGYLCASFSLSFIQMWIPLPVPRRRSRIHGPWTYCVQRCLLNVLASTSSCLVATIHFSECRERRRRYPRWRLDPNTTLWGRGATLESTPLGRIAVIRSSLVCGFELWLVLVIFGLRRNPWFFRRVTHHVREIFLRIEIWHLKIGIGFGEMRVSIDWCVCFLRNKPRGIVMKCECPKSMM